MKKIITTASLAALGAASVQAATPLDRSYYAPSPGLSSQERAKWWSVGASLRGFFDDNINTSPAGFKQDSYGFEVSPSLGAHFAAEQTFIDLTYQYSGRYFESRKDNQWDHTHVANLAIAHSFSETMKLDIKDTFAYAQEPEVFESGTTITGPLLRRSQLDNLHNRGSINFQAQLTELFSTAMGYENGYYDYQESGAGSYSALLDRREHLARIDFRWHALPTTIALVGYQYGFVEYQSKESLLAGIPRVAKTITDPESRDNRSHYVYVGADHQFNGQFTGTIRLGTQITEYPDAVDFLGAKQDRDTVSPYAEASVNYTYMENSFIQLGVRHAKNQTDVALASAIDPAATLDQETTTVYGVVSHRITPKLTGNLVGQAQNSRFNGGVAADKTDDLFLIGANLSYQINENFSTELG